MIYLELNDWALTVWNENGVVAYSEPAAASFLNNTLIFGLNALKTSSALTTSKMVTIAVHHLK